MGLDHLRLAIRAGEGLETFYRELGWRTVGRWPRALRLCATDVRDEVLMYLALGAGRSGPRQLAGSSPSR